MIRFPNAPARIKALPVNEKGFPIPFFAEEIDGKPELRISSQVKVVKAIKQNLCWVCGQPLGRHKAFTIGPMCAITRTTSEPPSHRECAEFAAVSCPFLSQPLAKRVDVEGSVPPPGIALMRNPGAVAVWITDSFKTFRSGNTGGGRDGTLIRMGDPTEILWYASGRRAKLEEVEASIDSGLHNLESIANKEGSKARAELDALVSAFRMNLSRQFARESAA